MHKIQSHIANNQERCAEFKQPFEEYKPLWTLDIVEELQKFLTDNVEEKKEVGASLGGVANAAVQGVVWNAIFLTGAALALYQSGCNRPHTGKYRHGHYHSERCAGTSLSAQ